MEVNEKTEQQIAQQRIANALNNLVRIGQEGRLWRTGKVELIEV